MAFDMDIAESDSIKGVWIVRPSVSRDSRGSIWTSFQKDEIEKLLPSGLAFKHDKFSVSGRNVLRGIHGDEKSWKLVTCVHGDILQVVVDCREESPTFRKYLKFRINADNMLLVLIPPRMGNAYYVFGDEAVYHYKLAYDGDYIDADRQFSIKWDDPSIGIDWPVKNPILSDRDRVAKP